MGEKELEVNKELKRINEALDKITEDKAALYHFGISVEGEAKYKKELRKMIKKYIALDRKIKPKGYGLRTCKTDYCKLRGVKTELSRCIKCGYRTIEFHNLPGENTLYGIGLDKIKRGQKWKQ